ncbi:MAG: NAD-dependent epimerase/dehydratase family protein [Fimbriimonadaceae bacterium]
MRLLVVGGTRFLGRHIVGTALEAGHDVTLFHRGRSGADLFEGRVHRVLGDRDEGFAGLEDQVFDVIIDTCAYFPRQVRSLVETFDSRVPRSYVLVSSVSVYKDPQHGADESAPVYAEGDPDATEITGDNYGFLKAQCEAEARSAWGDAVRVVRPGLIVGPHDPSDRFTYWVVRAGRGGPMLVPDALDQPVQVIDARDLADWIVRSVLAGGPAVANAAGPASPLTLGEMLDACRSVAQTGSELVKVSPHFLADNGVSPWTDLPLYLAGEGGGMLDVDASTAVASGLRFRPLQETIADTLAWARNALSERPLCAGLTPEREAELLQAWAERS